jgi:hypothetical protein
MGDDDRGPGGREGFEAATERSEGNPWVVHGLNAVLSTVFAVTIVWGLDFVGTLAFTPINVATAAVLIFAGAYLMSVR